MGNRDLKIAPTETSTKAHFIDDSREGLLRLNHNPASKALNLRLWVSRRTAGVTTPHTHASRFVDALESRT